MPEQPEPVPKDEVAAVLGTSRDLGPDYDDAVADALAERLEHTIDQRVEARLAERMRQLPAQRKGKDDRAAVIGATAIGSLLLGLPSAAWAAGSSPGVAAVIVAAILLINLIVGLGVRRL